MAAPFTPLLLEEPSLATLHLSTDASETLWQCAHCSKKFASRYTLSRHELKVQAGMDCGNSRQTSVGVPRRYRCIMCCRGYLTKGSLTRHLKSAHEAIFPHVVQIVTSEVIHYMGPTARSFAVAFVPHYK